MRHPLGTREFAVLTSSLLLCGMVGAYLVLPGLWAEYDARITLPRYHLRYGFESALVQMPPPQDRAHKLFVITKVTPGGPFDGAGFRPGDVPVDRHGEGMYALAWALRKADEGVSEEIKVTSFRSIVEQNWETRTIGVPVLSQLRAEPHDNEMQRTKPAQPMELRR